MMRVRSAAMAVVAGAALLGLVSGCLVPNQSTLVGVTGAHAASARVDMITFTFQQGVPSGITARYVPSPPTAPSGKPVALDGNKFVQVALTPVVAHDNLGDSTVAQAVYFAGATTNVVEAKMYEDFEGHVGFALGLDKMIPGTHPTVFVSGTTVVVDIPTA